MIVGLCGTGYHIPDHIRLNDDPLFDFIRENKNTQGISEASLFTGMKERRVLAQGEHIETFMVEAARHALVQAGMQREQIDRLYGYVSVSPYLTPNALYAVHHELQLSSETLVVPVNSEFSNFLLGVLQSWEAIIAGHSRAALIVCGTNWSQHMDYSQGHSTSIGDGAGAAIVGPDPLWEIIDYATQTRSEEYGAMRMHLRPVCIGDQRYLPLNEKNMPYPTYEITMKDGLHSFQRAEQEGPSVLVKALLQKHDVQGKDIALITHQASRVLLDAWAKSIQPAQYLETFEIFGNLALAAYPVNLAYFFPEIQTNYLVIAALGVGFHQIALLLRRRKSSKRSARVEKGH